VILSYIQTRPLLEARGQGREVVEVSPDLGLSWIEARLADEGVRFASGALLTWDEIEQISRSEVTCYTVGVGGIQPVQTFSEVTGRVCSLLPTPGAPALLLSGFVMHRIKEIDPWQHAQRMLAALAPISGAVLDTTTGLGYTAILAARRAASVTTIELDPGVEAIARLNPWSRELFANPSITRLMGDASEIVPTLPDGQFERIMHDPPALKLAGDLYSGAFYRELHRVLKRGGRLFHYIGDPQSKAGGSVTRGVLRRLQEAGFARVVPRAQAYGVVAYK
jgi:predicted methyltransferase